MNTEAHTHGVECSIEFLLSFCYFCEAPPPARAMSALIDLSTSFEFQAAASKFDSRLLRGNTAVGLLSLREE